MTGLQFSPAMALEIMRGNKSQTRRLVRLPDFINPDECTIKIGSDGCCAEAWQGDRLLRVLPYRQRCPGETVFMQEKWRAHKRHDRLSPREIDFSRTTVFYSSDYDAIGYPDKAGRARAAMHMPLAASRRVLTITGLRVERLHDITPEDAMDEGVFYEESSGWYLGAIHPKKGVRKVFPDPISAYESIFDSVYGLHEWRKNPWVWVIDFDAQPNIYAPPPAMSVPMVGLTDTLHDAMDIRGAATMLGRLGGKRGGPARARALDPERRSEIARAAANARWHNDQGNGGVK